MNDECQEYDTYSILPSFPTKSRKWNRAGNSHSHGSVFTGIILQTPTPWLSGLFLHKLFTLEPGTCLHCLHTSSLQSVASQRARTSAFIRSKKQFHQSGQDGATADTSLDSAVVEQLCYKLFVLPAQLSTSQLSALRGPARQNGSITALVTALWIFFFFFGRTAHNLYK